MPYYLKAPDLEFLLDGPIKIGNVITDMTTPQDPITFLEPLPEITQGAGYGEGKAETEHHASLNASLSARLYDAFGARAEAGSNSSLRTVYGFEAVSSWYFKDNLKLKKELKEFREKDEEFRNALRSGRPVYIVSGLKIAKGLKYSNQRVSAQRAAIGGGGHVSQEVAVEANLEAERGGENTAEWTVLGHPIIAYRLHVVKKAGWSWRGEGNLTAKTHDPGDAGFMSKEDELDEFEMDVEDISSDDVEFFVRDQEFEGVKYLSVRDQEEDWSLALLEE